MANEQTYAGNNQSADISSFSNGRESESAASGPSQAPVPDVSFGQVSFSQQLYSAQEAITSDDDAIYSEELLDEISAANYPPSETDIKRFEAPSDPEEYSAALQRAIDADRRNAHIEGSEFEITFEIHYATKVRTT